MSRNTVLKIKIGEEEIFVMGTWFHSHFDLAVTDGLHAWLCHGGEDEVRERAEQWDQKAEDYIQLAEKHLAFLHPDSTYTFPDAGAGCKRLSWTFEKEGTRLEWRWKCQPSSDSKKTTSEILNFLISVNARLSEEVSNSATSFDRLKEEAGQCLLQSERFCSQKKEFEDAIYNKFLAVLNAKKRKIGELRNKVSKSAKTEEKEESTDKTESCDDNTDESD